MNPEIVTLKDQFTRTFFQVKNIILLFHTNVNMQMKQYGINTAEMSLLKMVRENTPEGTDNVNSQDIQKRLCITKGAVSKILSSLEEKNYLRRQFSPQDRRSLIITLTQDGLDIVDQLEDVINDVFTELIGEMGRENAQQFINSANQLITATKSALGTHPSDSTMEERSIC